MTRIPDSVPWKAAERTLGEGGQSRVCLVNPEQTSDFGDGTYAMKILKNTKSEQAKKRFSAEIKAIRQVDDPRIVKIIDYSKDNDDFLYYVMPYDPDFKPLEKIAFSPDSPFKEEPSKCLEVVAQCAEALHKVHAKRISHRDIKPANILYHLANEKPLIIDFGCCHIFDHETITLTDEGVGTQNYMAPECESGVASEAHLLFLSDIYSLGKVLWALITGKTAFAREKPVFENQSMMRVFSENADCWHLTRIFQKTIRSDPKQRYTDAQKLADDCREVLRIMNKYPPLELVSRLCPACGQGQSELMDRNNELTPMDIFSPHIPQEKVRVRKCPVCGFISVWDFRVLRTREKELENMS